MYHALIVSMKVLNAIQLEQLVDGHHCNNEKENEANERGNEGNTTSVAVCFEFVTYLIPPCM